MAKITNLILNALCLIPIPWLGPVLAPVICSVTMIIMALLYVYLPEMGRPVKIKVWDWVLLLSGSAVIFFTFISDYLKLINSTGILSGTGNPAIKEQFWKDITLFVPEHYSWGLFWTGLSFILVSVSLVVRRSVLQDSFHREF